MHFSPEKLAECFDFVLLSFFTPRAVGIVHTACVQTFSQIIF